MLFPYESEATSRVYVWNDTSKVLEDIKVFGQTKFSAELNHEWSSSGVVDE